jgi:REP element-mobilizing transposase RayT
MGYDPDIHKRRSIRLQGFDYFSYGAYFVTVCVQGRECLLGEIVDGEMELNEAGRMVETWWRELSNKFPSVEIDTFVVMPNHFHGIVVINNPVGADLRVCPNNNVHVGADLRVGLSNAGAHPGAPLHGIVQWFKTMTTNAYIRGVKQTNWPPFPGRLWQRNYYERIVRDEAELDAIRKYIDENPLKWLEDDENPANIP